MHISAGRARFLWESTILLESMQHGGNGISGGWFYIIYILAKGHIDEKHRRNITNNCPNLEFTSHVMSFYFIFIFRSLTHPLTRTKQKANLSSK